MASTLLSIQNANVRHINNIIFSSLNFEVKTGEHWALVGESGSGKSALLNTIAGKLAITGGEAKRYFAEELLKQFHDTEPMLTFHRYIAMVESKHHFKNLSNTSDFYYQQRYNSSDSEDAQTVDQYLSTIHPAPGRPPVWEIGNIKALLNLESLMDKQLIKLSNGETKRLLIAAALLKNPVMLLLDNPLAGLDVQTRAAFNEIINKIADTGVTIIIATAADEIPAAITHVGLFNQGILTAMPKDAFHEEAAKGQHLISHNTSAIQELLQGYQQPGFEWIVKMNNVKVKYGEKVVLDDVNWEIKPGEKWALLGANGAGKSTLLSLINGDNPQAYANDIILFDKKRGTGESIWDIKRKTGFISPELYQYFPTDNSCLQVIESGFYDTIGLFRPSDKTKAECCMQWMKVLEIDQYARTLLKNIPTGAQRLCLLARAMIKNPTLLILDEPCQGMDTHQQEHFKTLVDTICSLCPVTLIYVTHYQHQVPESVKHTLRLDQGKVI